MKHKVKEHYVNDYCIKLDKEEIKRLAIESGLIESEKVEKPYGKLYVHHGNSEYLKVFTEETVTFGFEDNHWTVNKFSTALSLDFWKPATQSDRDKFNELLLAKAESMGYEDGNYECLVLPNHTHKHYDRYVSQYGDLYTHNECGASRNKVFDGTTGEWSKITIPTLTHEQLEEKVGKFKYKES
jgi:hypothetical protein